MKPSISLLRAFRHPLVIASIAALLLNDHVLKTSVPSPLTGKLSDVAGLFFFPFLLGLLIQRAARRPARGALLISFGLCALVFTALKTLPGINALAAEGLSRLFGLPVRIVLDPTDLLALIVFAPAYLLWRRIEAGPLTQPPGKLAYLALAAGSLAALATSPCPPNPAITRLAVDDNVLYAGQSRWGTPGYWEYALRSTDGGLTWTALEAAPDPVAAKFNQPRPMPITACDPANPRLCYRIDGSPRIDESRDGGATWRTAWQVPPARLLFIDRAASPQMIMACGKDPDLQTVDLALLPGPQGAAVVVAMGNEGFVVRHTDGAWQRLGSGLTGDNWDNFPAKQPEPTPFAARSIWDALVTTQSEMWPLLAQSLFIYLGLTQFGWLAAVRRGVKRPGTGGWVLSGILLALMAGIAVIYWLLYSREWPDFLIWLAGLMALLLVALILSPFLWNRAARLAAQPGQYGAQGWRAYGLGLLWFVLVYGVSWLWAFGVIPPFSAAQVTSAIVGLLALAGAVFLLYRHLKQATEAGVGLPGDIISGSSPREHETTQKGQE